MNEYLKIYERIKNNIIRGDYRFGDKLPSKRSAAADANVSVITVQHAYALLCDEGYVESRERSGFYVIYKEADFFGNAEPQLPELRYDAMGVHEKGEFSYNILTKIMRKVMLDYGERLLVKSPNAGCMELRREIQSYLALSRGIRVDVNQIIVGSGAEYLYGLVAQLFEGDELIAVEKPCYDKIVKVYEAMGHKTEHLRLGADGVLTSELNKTCARVLHVTPFNSYPSGVTASISKKYEYIKWAGADRYIVEDNYDSELTVSRRLEDALFSLALGKNVIYINTFSKTIAPSLRAGYMILPDNLAAAFNEKLGFYSCTVPVFEQYLLCELLRSGEYQRHLNRVRRKLRKENGIYGTK